MQALTASDGGRERNAAVLPLPAFTDNYIWAIVRDGQAAVVDPGEAGPVLRLLEQQGLRLRAILLTHHHGDHVGGVSELSRIEGLTVYGPAQERLPRCDVPLAQGDRVLIPELDLDLAVLDVPGHTAGHIAYTGRAAGVEPVLSAATPCLPAAVAGCSKAPPRKCLIPWKNFLFYRRIHRFFAHTSTL